MFVPSLAFGIPMPKPSPIEWHEAWLTSPETYSLSGFVTIASVKVGTAEYYLTQAVSGWFDPSAGLFRAFGLPFIVGRGDSPGAAYLDWELRFHHELQRLLSVEYFELGEGDIARRKALEGLVDMVRYRNTAPYYRQKIGYVDQARPYPSRIRWLDGQVFRIDYRKAPDPTLAGLLAGQWIEAQVRMDPVSETVAEIVTYRRIAPPAGGARGAPEQRPLSDLPRSTRKWTAE
jgi:hypothetical protein